MADIFLSYASADRERATSLASALEQLGYSVWWDREIHPGLNFEEVIEAEIGAARCVVAVWSQAALRSAWVHNEAMEGMERGVLVPVVLDDVRPPLAFRHLNIADLRAWTGDPGSEVLAPVERRVRRLLDGGAEPPWPSYGSPSEPAAPRRPGRWRPWTGAAAAVGLLLIGTFAWWEGAKEEAGSARNSVVVLDFENRADAELGYLATGVTDQVRNLLTRTPPVRVISRALSQQLGSERDLPDVDFLVEGSVMTGPERVQVDVHLVDARSGLRTWSQRFTRPRAALLDVTFDIARGIVRGMNLDPVSKSALQGAPRPVVPAAFEFYLRGSDWMRTVDDDSALQHAEDAFGAALEKDPDFAPAYAGLCRVNVRRYGKNREIERSQRARKQCERALGLDADLPEAHIALGSLHLMSGEPEQALDRYTSAVNVSPNEPDAALGLAASFGELGDPARAEQWYQRAVSMDPGYWRSYNGLGSLYFRQGRFQDAERAYQKVVALAPDSAFGWAAVAAARSMTGNHAGALAAWERSVELEPTAQAMSNAASAQYFLGHFEEAEQLYRKALALEPDHHVAWGNLGEVLMLRSEPERAAEAFAEAARLARANLEVNERDTQALSRLATYLSFDSNARNDVHQLIEHALAIDPGDPYIHYDAALADVRLGDYDAARTHLADAIGRGYPKQLADADPQLDVLR